MKKAYVNPIFVDKVKLGTVKPKVRDQQSLIKMIRNKELDGGPTSKYSESTSTCTITKINVK